jgi:hypothetical protein
MSTTWSEVRGREKPTVEFIRVLIRVIRFVVLRAADFCIRSFANLVLMPVGYFFDYILSWLNAKFHAYEKSDREVHMRFQKVMQAASLVKNKLTLALDSVIQSEPTKAIRERIRSISTLTNVELECVWLNSMLRFSFTAGLSKALEHSTEEYIRGLLESHPFLRSVGLLHVSLGKVAPVIRSVKVHERSSGAQELTTDIECSWASDEGEILFQFADISGSRRYLRLYCFRLYGLSRCTFDSPSSAFMPWNAMSCQFYDRPSVRFQHESFLESGCSDSSTAPVTSMVVDGIVSLLKQRLKDVALAPRSVRFNLSSSGSTHRPSTSTKRSSRSSA